MNRLKVLRKKRGLTLKEMSKELKESEEVKQLTDWYDFKYCPYCGRKL